LTSSCLHEYAELWYLKNGLIFLLSILDV